MAFVLFPQLVGPPTNRYSGILTRKFFNETSCPRVKTVGYVVHQPHLYGTVFPLVECLSPTNRNPGQWIFYPMFGITCSLYISCENLLMGNVFVVFFARKKICSDYRCLRLLSILKPLEPFGTL